MALSWIAMRWLKMWIGARSRLTGPAQGMPAGRRGSDGSRRLRTQGNAPRGAPYCAGGGRAGSCRAQWSAALLVCSLQSHVDVRAHIWRWLREAAAPRRGSACARTPEQSCCACLHPGLGAGVANAVEELRQASGSQGRERGDQPEVGAAVDPSLQGAAGVLMQDAHCLVATSRRLWPAPHSTHTNRASMHLRL